MKIISFLFEAIRAEKIGFETDLQIRGIKGPLRGREIPPNGRKRRQKTRNKLFCNSLRVIFRNGGGEGSRTPVRNAVNTGIYMFSMMSGASDGLGPHAALPILETCLISENRPVTRR